MIATPNESGDHQTPAEEVFTTSVSVPRDGVVHWFVYRYVRRTAFDAMRAIHRHFRAGYFPLTIANLATKNVKEVLDGQHN